MKAFLIAFGAGLGWGLANILVALLRAAIVIGLALAAAWYFGAIKP